MIRWAIGKALVASALGLLTASAGWANWIGWAELGEAGAPNVRDVAQSSTPDSTPSPPQSDAQTGAQSAILPGQAAAPRDQLNVNPLTGQVSASGVDYKPLTGDQRWRLYFKASYASWGAYFGPFFAALVLDQSTGDPKEWGGGFKGYGRRVASRVGGSIVQNTVQYSGAALLREDVRYIASNQHGFKRRTGHALLYGVLTYNNSGHPTPNFANLGGYYAASATTTLWLPGRRNVAAYILSDGSQQAGLGAMVNVIQEFWPEIRRVLKRR